MTCSLHTAVTPAPGDEITNTALIRKTEEQAVQQPFIYKEDRRFSATIAIDHRQKLQEMALQFELPQPTNEKSELIVRRSSLPKGLKLEVQVAPPQVHTERKMIEVKQRAEAIETHRQELKIPPLIQHHRRFSETVALDHRQRPQEVELQFQLQQRPQMIQKSQLTILQMSTPVGQKLDVEVPKGIVVPMQESSHYELIQRRRIEAVQVVRQELMVNVKEEHGSSPAFVWHLQSQKIMDGEQVRFACKVRGCPMPDVTWYHNRKVIYDNPDFRTTYNRETGDLLLQIIEAFPQDKGFYECIAVNKYGSSSTSADLEVEGNL